MHDFSILKLKLKSELEEIKEERKIGLINFNQRIIDTWNKFTDVIR